MAIHILIIDKSTNTQLLLKNNLELVDNYRVFSVYNTQEGLKMTTEHFPDIIVLDIDLPDAKPADFIKQVKNHPLCQNIPIILMGAITPRNKEDLIFIIKKGLIVDFIAKPLNIHKTVTQINLRLAEKIKKQNKKDNSKGIRELITINRNSGHTYFIFKDLVNIQILQYFKSIYTPYFERITLKEKYVFDLRNQPALTVNEINIFINILMLIKKSDVFLLAGKNYGSFVLNEFFEKYKSFITYEDLKKYLDTNEQNQRSR